MSRKVRERALLESSGRSMTEGHTDCASFWMKNSVNCANLHPRTESSQGAHPSRVAVAETVDVVDDALAVRSEGQS